MSNGIDVQVQGGVQIVRMNRPEKKNALTRAMYQSLAEALLAAEKSGEIGATVFLGLPGIFTAGNDLNDFLAVAMGGEHGREVVGFLMGIAKGTKPLVAAVDGIAVGVGTTMLAHCDLVYASPQARLSTPFLDLGLVPEAASSLTFPRLMGHQRAFAMLCAGEVFSAEQARDAGLINAIVPSEDVEKTAIDAARRLAAKPPAALAIARRLVRGNREEVEARIVEEGKLFASQLQSAEAREAFMAFMEKRPPDFAKLRKAG